MLWTGLEDSVDGHDGARCVFPFGLIPIGLLPFGLLYMSVETNLLRACSVIKFQ